MCLKHDSVTPSEFHRRFCPWLPFKPCSNFRSQFQWFINLLHQQVNILTENSKWRPATPFCLSFLETTWNFL